MAPKRIPHVAAPDQAGRVRVRATLGRLNDLRVAARTWKRYTEAAKLFQTWVVANGLGLAIDFQHMDFQLCEYLEYLWESGQTKARAADTLSGVCFYLRVHNRFQGAWQLYRQWTRYELPKRALLCHDLFWRL